MLQNCADTHVHTLFSRHAYSTIEEDVRAAAKCGLELIGITDHYSPMVAQRVRPLEYQHFFNLGIVPRHWMGVSVLRGVEADIVDLEGHLFGHDLYYSPQNDIDVWCSPDSLETQVLRQCDYAIASVHGRGFTRNASARELTRMYVAALEHPKVLTLGHLGRTGLSLELGPIIRAAFDLGKLIEINEHSFCYGDPKGERAQHIRTRCRDVALACAEAGVRVAVNTDAHIACEIGRFDRALSLLDEIDFPQSLIATTSAQTFLTALDTALGSGSLAP